MAKCIRELLASSTEDRRRLYLCATRALHNLTFVEGEALPEVYKAAENLMRTE